MLWQNHAMYTNLSFAHLSDGDVDFMPHNLCKGLGNINFLKLSNSIKSLCNCWHQF